MCKICSMFFIYLICQTDGATQNHANAKENVCEISLVSEEVFGDSCALSQYDGRISQSSSIV